MKEQRRFLMPADRWDTDLLESWLEDMGARGWLPVKCSARTVIF